MQLGSLSNAADGQVVVANVRRTTQAWERLRGLLAQPPLAPDQGLLIDPCGSVHTLFMAHPIDVVYLDRNFVIVRVVETLRPWRFSMAWGAVMTLELGAGVAATVGLRAGEALVYHPAQPAS